MNRRREYQVVMTGTCGEFPDLPCRTYEVALERLKIANISCGSELTVRVNECELDERIVVSDVVDYAPDRLVYVRDDAVSGRPRLELKFYPESTTVDGVEAVFRLRMVEKCEMVESVALVQFETVNKRLKRGRRYYVKMSGVSSDFYVDSRHHLSAIYTFVGAGYPTTHEPAHLIYFPYDGESHVLQLVDEDDEPVEFRSHQYFKITVSVKNELKTYEMMFKIGSNPRDVIGYLSFVDSAVLIVNEMETCPKICIRKLGCEMRVVNQFEVALVRLQTRSNVFHPDARVVLMLMDTGRSSMYFDNGPIRNAIYLTKTDRYGAIDDEPKHLFYCEAANTMSMHAFTLVFKYHPSGQTIDVADGTFEAHFHVRAIDMVA